MAGRETSWLAAVIGVRVRALVPVAGRKLTLTWTGAAKLVVLEGDKRFINLL